MTSNQMSDTSAKYQFRNQQGTIKRDDQMGKPTVNDLQGINSLHRIYMPSPRPQCHLFLFTLIHIFTSGSAVRVYAMSTDYNWKWHPLIRCKSHRFHMLLYPSQVDWVTALSDSVIPYRKYGTVLTHANLSASSLWLSFVDSLLFRFLKFWKFYKSLIKFK